MILMRKRYILGGRAGLQKQHSMAGQYKNDILSSCLISQTIWPGIWPDPEPQVSNAGSDTYTSWTFLSKEPQSLTTAPKPQITAQTSPAHCYKSSDSSYLTAHILVHTRHSFASCHARNHTVMGISTPERKIRHTQFTRSSAVQSHTMQVLALAQ